MTDVIKCLFCEKMFESSNIGIWYMLIHIYKTCVAAILQMPHFTMEKMLIHTREHTFGEHAFFIKLSVSRKDAKAYSRHGAYMCRCGMLASFTDINSEINKKSTMLTHYKEHNKIEDYNVVKRIIEEKNTSKEMKNTDNIFRRLNGYPLTQPDDLETTMKRFSCLETIY
eukprot:GHVR01105532.1.p2 GENE.GHVR01105532.1~~GHVR01105532.1.p2  ORF type:complete len:169 (+),score=10.94 GHVR01105532.1:714-1220(+)